MSNLPVRWRSYLLLFINAIVWALPLILVKPALEFTTPFRYLFYRYALAGLFSLPILWYYLKHKQTHVSRASLLKITGVEMIGTVAGLTLLYTALQHLGAIETALLSSSAPIFVTLGGIYFLKEREEKYEWIGLFFAFIGTLLLISYPLLINQAVLTTVSILGISLVLAQNLTGFFYFPLAKKHYHGLPKLLVAALSFYIVTPVFLALSWAEAGSLSQLLTSIVKDVAVPSVQLASLYMAIFGSIIGLTTYIKAQDGIEASEAALFSYLHPLIYIPLAITLLKEQISFFQVLALLIITTGVVIAEHRQKRRQTHRLRRRVTLARHH